jgi:hypothetical protein
LAFTGKSSQIGLKKLQYTVEEKRNKMTTNNRQALIDEYRNKIREHEEIEEL